MTGLVPTSQGFAIVSHPPPRLSQLKGVVFTVTCDGIAKEQRGDSGVYATRRYNVLI